MTRFVRIKRRGPGLMPAALIALASIAHALPVELKDQNGTKYEINTQVDPLLRDSNASGAITNATYVKPVTVTSYFVGFTPFGFFLTTETVQRQVNIPLTNAFAGFNGLLITGAHGVALPQPQAFNPGQALAAEECQQGNQNRQLSFQTQTFPNLDLQVTRKVFVPNNGSFIRWLNIVTNTGSAPQQVGITLEGLLGSGSQTKIITTSTGDSILTAGDLWFTSTQSVPQGAQVAEPVVGFVIQGNGATTPARSAGINSLGQAIATYTPTIPAGGQAVVMTFATVGGNNKQAKNTVTNVVALPSNSLFCLSQQELHGIVNFAPITPPQLKSATITLKFNKTGQDTVQWKGKITVGAGITLTGLPVTVDVGGATASFVLAKNGKANNGDGNKFALNAKLKNGVTKQATVNFSFNLKGAFQEQLASYGLTNADAKKVAVSVPVTLTAGPGEYATDQAFTYTATQGKKGTAKSS
jgi:hypothetical protein